MNFILFTTVSLCAIALTSCQDNEIFDKPAALTGDAKIKFAAIQNLGTKAADGHPFNNTNDLRNYGSFNVSGFGTDGAIDGRLYLNATPTYNSSTWEYSNESYWPDQMLNFAGYAPTEVSGVNLSAAGITKSGFTIEDNSKQIDFVVAIEPGKSKEERTMLRFKHTLTQVLFKAIKVRNSDLGVSIEEVEICNIKKEGNFSAPMSTNVLKQNVWTPSNTLMNFSANPAKSIEIIAEDVVGKYTNAQRIQENATDNNALILLPQNFKAWDGKVSIATNDGNGGAKGAYVRVKTLITATKSGNTVVLWGTTNNPLDAAAKNLYIPVQSLGTDLAGLTNDDNDKNTIAIPGQWVPGRRINYIITFGDTGSGSGGGGFDEGGNPVLVPIRFTAEVEDWADTELPLLSATVEGTTSQPLSATLIDGYTNQVLADIATAQSPKNFFAKVNMTGTSTTAFGDFTFNVDMFTPAISAKFLTGSTFSWDIKASAWGKITIPAAPTGWSWKGVTVNDEITSNTILKLEKN